VGLRLRLKGEFNYVQWYGRGPQENYPDRKSAAMVLVNDYYVRDQECPYIYPQEFGARQDVRWLRLLNPGQLGLRISGTPTFAFSALPYRLEDLSAARNVAELTPRDEVNLHIDGFHLGVGGDTGWSRNVYPEYLLPPGTYPYAVVLRPEVAEEGSVEPSA